MPISDLFIAKQIQNETIIRWKLFDAYKLNYGYDIEIQENGIIIETNSPDELTIIGANFSSARRQNLKGTIVCQNKTYTFHE